MVDLSADLTRWLRRGLLLPIIALNGWVVLQLFQYFEPLVTIFITAAVLAFILNYPVEFLYQRLQSRQIDRNYAVLIVLVVSGVGLATLAITLLPALLEQLSGIVTQLPNWSAAASQKLQAVQNWAAVHRLPINLNRLIRQFTDRLPAQLEGLGDETLSLTLNAAGGITSLLLVFVLTLYLLLDGKRVWRTLFRWLPPEQRDRIRRSLQHDFHSYFIGQATLGVIMGVVLTIIFLVLNVPYSLLLGSMVGIMTLIPFGDVLSYGLICLLLAAQSPGLAITTLAVALLIDQIVDQAIAPRILGSFTGLKPIWVIIALLLGTKLFGFPGLLTAVPIASFINSFLEGDMPEENRSEEPAEATIATESSPAFKSL
ncbi:AI-2E family transporter [Phormidium tenue FACHB-886]|nr:AI-2E family transporter [Phormidium tenue FACHB-886]